VRSNDEIIREAWLLASAPEAVASYLRKRGERLAADPFIREGDKELEEALLARNEPLIDLALARYCRYSDTAKKLFFKQNAALAIRLSVLSNRCLYGVTCWLPVDLFDKDEAKLASYLASAGLEELNALFENPKLHDLFLSQFLEGDGHLKGLDEARQLAAIHALSRNERMRTEYDGDLYEDGFDAYSYETVFTAAWKLAKWAPTTPQWGVALNSLYDKLLPETHSSDAPLEIAIRWLPQDAQQIKQYAHFSEDGYLSDCQGVRRSLAKLALSKDSSLTETLLASDDIALRCAAYAFCDLATEAIQKAFENDGPLAYMQLVDNDRLWRQDANRRALHNMAWAVTKQDRHSDMSALQIHENNCNRHSKEHPEWFWTMEKPEDDPLDKPTTVSDLNRLYSKFDLPIAKIERVDYVLEKLNNKVGFIWWFSLGALAMSLVRHL
jgi:hypothetical protein